MNGTVAVRTAAKEGPRLVSIAWNLGLDLLVEASGEILRDRQIAKNTGPLERLVERIVQRVTTDAKHGLGGREQIWRNGAMGRVTGPAVFGHGGMLVRPRSHEILMAARAALIGPSGPHTGILVRIVATHAGHAAFGHRMMAGVTKLGAHVPVALDAQLRGRIHIGKARAIEWAQGKALAVVRIVAVAADQARFGVSPQSPLQVGIASGRVASEAIPAARVANIRHRFAFRVQASAAVARFAVRVVDRHRGLPVHILVADPAFLGAFGKSARDGLGTPRTHGAPHHRRAGDAKNECGEEQQGRGESANSFRVFPVF